MSTGANVEDGARPYAVGQWVIFQTAYGILGEGEVIEYAPCTGRVTVRNDDEDMWTGPAENIIALLNGDTTL